MEKYHKIETVFERDPKSKSLIWGKFINPTIEFLKDNLWDFTEKVDGTNIRVYWDGYKVSYGGRTDDSEIPNFVLEKLNELFSGEDNAQLFEQKFKDKPVMLIGEAYGPKVNKGHLYRDDIDFILFDVVISGNYQPRSSVENIADYFGLNIVPVLFSGTLMEGIKYIKGHPKSVIAKNGAYMEGLVARTHIETLDRCGNRNIVKIKWRDFRFITLPSEV